MTDMRALQLHRARRTIDREIERWDNMPKSDLASGVVLGLMKARIEIFTPEASAESWRVRKEMFG